MKKTKKLESLQNEMFNFTIQHSSIHVKGAGLTFYKSWRCWTDPYGGDTLFPDPDPIIKK